MTDAIQIAEALRGLCTGDQDPPRPWAHMSHVGTVVDVSRVLGGRYESRFHMHVDGDAYMVTVQKFDAPA